LGLELRDLIIERSSKKSISQTGKKGTAPRILEKKEEIHLSVWGAEDRDEELTPPTILHRNKSGKKMEIPVRVMAQNSRGGGFVV